MKLGTVVYTSYEAIKKGMGVYKGNLKKYKEKYALIGNVLSFLPGLSN
jgi:uncharacterized BrkB/YihY/UPF0761 family membrane protein